MISNDLLTREFVYIIRGNLTYQSIPLRRLAIAKRKLDSQNHWMTDNPWVMSMWVF